MRSQDIEAWVLAIVDRLKANQPVEDSNVELKSKWSDRFDRMARRLAGHCNAARGEPVLWIIGIDEKSDKVVGAERSDLVKWLDAVRLHFDSLPPDLEKDMVVPVEDTSVVAMLFDTSRAPYVVKNPANGQPGGGPVEREVPWRDGTSVRSARREDLIRLLVPIHHLPAIELLNASLGVSTYTDCTTDPVKEGLRWELSLELYVEPVDRNRVVIPVHRCVASTVALLNSEPCPLKKIRMGPWLRAVTGGGPAFPTDMRLSRTIDSSPTEVIVDGPGLVLFSAETITPPIDREEFRGEVDYSVVLGFSGSNHEFRLSGTLRNTSRTKRDEPIQFIWARKVR